MEMGRNTEADKMLGGALFQRFVTQRGGVARVVALPLVLLSGSNPLDLCTTVLAARVASVNEEGIRSFDIEALGRNARNRIENAERRSPR